MARMRKPDLEVLRAPADGAERWQIGQPAVPGWESLWGGRRTESGQPMRAVTVCVQASASR
jgi:hypothetical protein